jgi:hypothetical protein
MKTPIPALLSTALALIVPILTTTASAEETPIRIHYFGNSLTDTLRYDSFMNLSGGAVHPLEWKREMAPGVPVNFWWKNKPNWEKKLTDEKWDVVTLQPFAQFEMEYEASENFAKFLKEKQPDTQLYIYAQWQGRRTGDWQSDFTKQAEYVKMADLAPADWRNSYKKEVAESSWLENVAASAQAAGETAKLERTLKNEYELIVQGLRARVPLKNPVKLIPAGHVIELLDSKMRAGLVPGYQSPYQIYCDGVHLDNVGSYIVAATFYSTIFKTSPVGLAIGEYQADPKSNTGRTPISDALAKVIQETVWEVVATHPLTGVTSNEKVHVASASLANCVQGEPYRFELFPAFGKAPYVWSVDSGKLPEGLTLAPSGLVTGTATGNPGDYKVTVAVKASAETVATRELAIKVEPDTSPAIKVDATLPTRRLGENFSLKLTSEGGNGAMQWEPVKREGGLPPGLMLHPDGTLFGSPGQEGEFTFDLKVTDADTSTPETATQTFNLKVTPPGSGVFRVRVLPKETARPVVDGVLDEPFWNPKEPIAKKVVGENTNIQAFFDIVRHGGGDIFVAVKVIDPDRHVKLDKLTDGDSVVAFLDVLNNREKIYNFDDRVVGIAPTKDWYNAICVSPTGNFGHQGKITETADGYTAEFWFNFWALGFDASNLPGVMGFDLAINDDDDGGGRDSEIVWQGTADNFTQPDKFGTIIIEADPKPQP